MAEAFLNSLGSDKFDAESAGLDPKAINPLVIEVMKEMGIDLSEKRSHSVFQFFTEGRMYDYVITVCDESVEEKCPIFPGVQRRIRWPFPDPGRVTGSHEEQLKEVRKIRDTIRTRIESWVQ